MINDFDYRQIKQMKSLIVRLQNNQIGYSKFVSDQWTLVEYLQSIDQKWKAEYFSLISIIEDVFSTALDRNKEKLDQNDTETIEETLKKC